MRTLSLVALVIALFTAPSAHAAWACVATCHSPDDAYEQISSGSFATQREARADLANYCHSTYIENVRCYSKGNPSADAPVASLLQDAYSVRCSVNQDFIRSICQGGELFGPDENGLLCCRRGYND